MGLRNWFPGGSTSAPTTPPGQMAMHAGTNGIQPPYGYGTLAVGGGGISGTPVGPYNWGTHMVTASMTSGMWGSTKKARVEPALTEVEMSEVAESLRAWAKLRAAQALGPFRVGDTSTDNRSGSLHCDLSPDLSAITSTIGRKQLNAIVAKALGEMPIGARCWIIVEE